MVPPALCLGILFAGSVNGIHDAVFNRFGGGHKEVPVGIAFDLFELLAGVAGEDRVEDRAQAHDLFALDLNVGGSSFCAAPGLVDHNAGVGQRKTFPRSAGGEQNGSHTGTLTETYGFDITGDRLDRVIDGKTGSDRTSGRVDVKIDVLSGRFRLQKKQLGDNEIGDIVIDRRAEQDDAVFEQA